MTFGDQLRHRVRQAIDAARSRAAGGRRRVRVLRPTNIVVARNIGGRGENQGASASQTVVVKNGAVQERTERTEVSTGAPKAIDHGGKEWKDP